MPIVNKIATLIGGILIKITKIQNRLISSYQLSKISNRGGCFINGPGYFSYKNIALGRNVYIGVNSTFMSSDAKINIKDNVVFGPHCFIISGDHAFDIIGKAINTIHEKRPKDDADITIDEECWLGANCIILKGVHIGRGCVVGAGSIVTKDIPPYTIYTNKGMRPRFSSKQIAEHERILYGQLDPTID